MTRRPALEVVDYLDHILQAAERAIASISGVADRAAFEDRWLEQEAAIRLITVIGEASAQLLRAEPGFVAGHPEVPWEKMTTMRNRVVHGYFEVDLDIVWTTIKQDLPKLVERIQPILEAMRGDPR